MEKVTPFLIPAYDKVFLISSGVGPKESAIEYTIDASNINTTAIRRYFVGLLPVILTSEFFMLWPFVALGGYIFWASIAIFLLAMMLWIREDYLDVPFIAVGLFAAFVVAFVDVPWSWFAHNYLMVVMIFAVYAVFGISWSFLKWLFFLQDKATEYTKNIASYQNNFTRAKDRGQYPDRSFAWYMRTEYDLPPSALKNKTRLMYWAFFWPFSILKFMLSDFLRKVWDFIYSKLSGLYQRVANAVFAKFPELKDE